MFDIVLVIDFLLRTCNNLDRTYEKIHINKTGFGNIRGKSKYITQLG